MTTSVSSTPAIEPQVSTPAVAEPAAATASPTLSSPTPQATPTGGEQEEDSLLGKAVSKSDGAAVTPEAKAKEDGSADQKQPSKDGKPEEKKVSGAPEKYTDFTLPDGLQLSKEMAEAFPAIAKELNLTQEQAQKLVDLQSQSVTRQHEEQQAEFKAIQTEWKNETIQALGPNYESEMGFAAKVIDRFGTPELRTLFNETGIGNHKEMATMLIKLGKAISEDGFVEGSNQAGSKGAANVLYPNLK